MSVFQKATKRAVKARVALDGPTGSGKTWTALTWATVLGKRIALIDTERGSASLYSDHFDFDVLEMTPPYEPQRLVEALVAAEKEGYEVVVIDSLSHFWEGEGGTLDIVDGASQRANGNSFAGWKVGTPALRHLIDTMLGLDAHLIVTMRSKMEYVLEEDSRGKKVPRKIGMAPVMRAGVEYEFTLVGDLDLEHRLSISKSRSDLLADQVYQAGRAAEGAETFKTWLEAGEPVAPRNEVDALKSRLNALDGPARKAFRDQFGRPDGLLLSQLDDAKSYVAGLEGSTEGGEGDVTPPKGDAGEPTATSADDPPNADPAAGAPAVADPAADGATDPFADLPPDMANDIRGNVEAAIRQGDFARDSAEHAKFVERAVAEGIKARNKRALDVVNACKAISLDSDDDRHALVAAITDNRTSSSKAITYDELRKLNKTVAKITKGELVVVRHGDGTMTVAESREAVAS